MEYRDGLPMPGEGERFRAGEYLSSALEICMRLAFRHKRDFRELNFMSDAIGKARQVVIDTENQVRQREVSAFVAGCRAARGVEYDYELGDDAQALGDAALKYAGVDAQGCPIAPTTPANERNER